MILLAALAHARDVDIKVHDMKGGVTGGEVSVALTGSGGSATFTCRDDGAAPDAVAGDHMYTARAEGLAVENGKVAVEAAGRTWEGGFQFDAQSDPVLLVGLEANGFAAASTREIMFMPDQPADRGPAPPPGGGTGAPPPPSPTEPRARTGLPDGMWLGWVVAAACLVGLGQLAYVGARRPPRIPPLRGPAPVTTHVRGPFVPGPAVDLYVGAVPPGGPADALSIGEGRWTPEEIALAALRIRVPVRVVVTDPARVEATPDAYAALSAALAGVADLLWLLVVV